MAPPALRGALQVSLKICNFVLAVLGIGMVVYAALVLNEWRKSSGSSDSPSPPSPSPPSPPPEALVSNYLGALGRAGLAHVKEASYARKLPYGLKGDSSIELPAPWFVYAFLGAGVVICLVTFSGAIAAELHSKFCLTIYQVGIAVMLVVQIALAAFLFFDKSWDKEIPDDPTGQLEKMKEFIKKNITILKWFGLAVLIVQILAVTLAMILHSINRAKDDERERERARGEEEVTVRRLKEPLLPPDAAPGQYVIDNPPDSNRGEKKKGKW